MTTETEHCAIARAVCNDDDAFAGEKMQPVAKDRSDEGSVVEVGVDFGSGLTASGDRAKTDKRLSPHCAIDPDDETPSLTKPPSLGDKSDIGVECIVTVQGEIVLVSSKSPNVTDNADTEEIILEDNSPVADTTDADEVDGDYDHGLTDMDSDINDISEGYECTDPSTLVVCGHRIKLHTPLRSSAPEEKGIDSREPPEGKEDTDMYIGDRSQEYGHEPQMEAVATTPAEYTKCGPQRPSLSPVIEEDVLEYVQSWASYDGDELDDGGDVDCGAGDATSIVEAVIVKSQEDYATELSRVLSSAAVDAALAEIDYETRGQISKESTAGTDEDLDDSADDVIIILPEARELNYDNVPVGAGFEYGMQDATNARNQLDAQADFLENSLNCLEITLDRMSLNEAVMPDGSVVFLKDQLRRARTGHLLRAWEKARGFQDEYISDGEIEKPLAHIQKELYQGQINNLGAANDDMRTTVTQATLQEQALRGQARQMQQTFSGLEQNISLLSHELVGLHSRQRELQNALMEERRAKEAAQRENEIIYRRSSSDILAKSADASYEDHVGGHPQSRWIQDRSRSTSSTDLPPPGAPSAPLHPTLTPRWQGERDFIQPPPWRRSYRPPFSRRMSYAPRPWRPNWRWNGPRDVSSRPWERRRPPYPRPFVARPPPPIPFTQPFKKETEILLRQYFNKMGRVESLLRERGFAKGPAATAPPAHFRQRPARFQGYYGRPGGWGPPFRRGGLASRSSPSMGDTYRDRSQRSTRWFESSRSQTYHHPVQNEHVHHEAASAGFSVPQAAASA